jgi:hypothetical protein
MNRSLKSIMSCIAAIAMSLVLSVASARAADDKLTDVDHQLLKQAPDILKQLAAKGDRNVGILKFRIQKGNNPPSAHVGTLNLDLADRLEMALILKNDARHPIGIIHDASSVAATINGADHVTAAGRQKLFTKQYPLAWGKNKVDPDAFLTGVVEMDEKNNELTIGIAMFDRKGSSLEKLCDFKAKPSLKELGEAGESFVLRGIFDSGSVKLSDGSRSEKAEDEASKEVALIKASKSNMLPKEHPLAKDNPDAPVALQVLYNDKPVPYEFRNGEAMIPEPLEGQNVKLVLIRKIKDRTRYGVTLKVNGENTIAHQRLPDADCRKWIIEPAGQPIVVIGYSVDGRPTAEEFRVASVPESKAREMDYGRDVGTISMTVFRQQPTDLPPPSDLPGGPDEDFAILKRNVFPPKTPDTLVAMQEQLRGVKQDSVLRGLILQGQEVQQRTIKVDFAADPIPVMSGVITYYRK